MGDYPRELNLDSETEERLRSYLDTELFNSDAERGPFLDKLIRYQREYWAEPVTEQATFPFTGAATIVIPLAAIAVEAIHSRNMTMLFALNQFVAVKSLDDPYADLADPLEKFLDTEFVKGMQIEKQLQSPSLEFIKFGTAVGKSGYEKIVKTAVRDSGNGEEVEFDVVVRQGPTFDGVPLNRFIMPYAALDPQTAPWVGEWQSRTPYEVFGMIDSGFFRPGTREKLEQWLTMSIQSSGSPAQERKFEESQASAEKMDAVWPKRLDWAEIELAFDVDKSGKQKEIVVHYHREARVFMSIRYNWTSNLRRQYRIGQFFPVEHRWTGIGVCKQVEQFQKEVTTQHRQRLDNATLANCRMIKINKMAGYGPKEPIFPGKMWFVDDIKDVDSFQLAEIYPSAYNDESATLQYSQQRTGINEVNLGMPQVGTPGTATSDLARIQEGNKKHDYTSRNFKRFVNEVLLDATCNIHQFGPRNQSYLSSPTRQAQLAQFFEMPIEMLVEGTCLEIGVASSQRNKLVDRQNYQQVLVGVTQYYTELFNLAMQTGNQQLAQLIAQKAPYAATEVMKQMLETFDMNKIDRIILSELLGPANGTQIPTIGAGAGGTQAPFTAPQLSSSSPAPAEAGA